MIGLVGTSDGAAFYAFARCIRCGATATLSMPEAALGETGSEDAVRADAVAWTLRHSGICPMR